jgi:prepilin-type processing-associated H-X9-DG protein
LPYIEQRNVYAKFDQSAGAYAAANAEVRALPISIAICPTYPGEETLEEGTIAVTTYAGCYHDVEAPIDDDNHGLLFLNSRVRLDEIFDGSTNTLLIAEKLVASDDLGWVSGTRATLRNTQKIDRPVPQFQQAAPLVGEDDKRDVAESLFVGGFGGHHPGGFNAGFADGSTRFVEQDVDPAVWRLVGNRADGEIVKPF